MTALNIEELSWRSQRIIPVLTVATTEQALAVGQVLLECGFRIVELTLRTRVALEAIAALSDEVSGLTVGAGTVSTPSDIDAAVKAGARFLVSPGQSAELLAAGRSAPVPYIPGGVTPSEFLAIRAAGYIVAKFFPAESAGGAKALADLAGPLFDMAFIPTGGIGPQITRTIFRCPTSWQLEVPGWCQKTRSSSATWKPFAHYARRRVWRLTSVVANVLNLNRR